MADKSVFVDCFLSHNLGDDLFFFTLVSRYPKVNFTVYADRSYEYLSNRFPNVKLITSAESSSSRFGTADKIMRVCSAMRQRIALIPAKTRHMPRRLVTISFLARTSAPTIHSSIWIRIDGSSNGDAMTFASGKPIPQAFSPV